MNCGTARKLQNAIEKLERGKVAEAMTQISLALGAASRHVYPSPKVRDGQAYKEFLHDNLEMITRVAFHGLGITTQWRIKYVHADLQPDSAGECSIEQILYHVVRCADVHGGEFPADIRFAKTGSFPYDGKPGILLPEALAYGLIVAVVVACPPIPPGFKLDLPIAPHGRLISAASICGDKTAALKLLGIQGTIGTNRGVIVSK